MSPRTSSDPTSKAIDVEPHRPPHLSIDAEPHRPPHLSENHRRHRRMRNSVHRAKVSVALTVF